MKVGVRSLQLTLSGVLLLFISSSCKYAPNQRRVVEKERMIELMAEVYLVEMHYQKAYGIPGLYQEPLERALIPIFKKHQISRKQYELSFTYYASHPSLFLEMNESVIQRYNEASIQR